MAQTPDGTPYVEGSDFVSGYPAISQALAEQIDALRTMIPVGTIIQCAAQPAAAGWILCDGAMYSRSDLGSDLYIALFEYWAVGGIVVPNNAPIPVPDLRGRVVIGAGTDGHPANNVDRPIGRRGGDTRYQAHLHMVNDSAYASNETAQPDGTNKYEAIPMAANEATGKGAARGASAITTAAQDSDINRHWVAHPYSEKTRGEPGSSGNLPPYAVIPSFIYAGKSGPFTKVGDIKDTYPVPSVSPASMLDIPDGEVPPPTDLEHNPAPGYWAADNAEG